MILLTSTPFFRKGIPTTGRSCPSARMFFAAFISPFCTVPQCRQDHSLIRNPALPFGLLVPIEEQHEQVTEEYFSFTILNNTFAFSHLYRSIVLNNILSLSYQIVNSYMLHNLTICEIYLVQAYLIIPQLKQGVFRSE